MRKLLWQPTTAQIEHSQMYAFMQEVNRRYQLNIRDYRALQLWSTAHLEDFWAVCWDFLDVIASRPYNQIVDDASRLPGADWFPGAELNYAENILRHCHGPEPAVIFRGESQVRRVLSRDAFYHQVVCLAAAFRAAGVQPGDAIAAYMPNLPETCIAMLAAAAVGAVWCSCATDIGPQAAVDRLGQVAPKLLITADAYFYKGKTFPVLSNAAVLAQNMPSVQQVIVVHYAGDTADPLPMPNAVRWEDYLASEPEGFSFAQLPARHPLVVMFSSGTTGKPKCMVQSAGGLLLNQLKELVLHNDLRTGDRMLYITTCSWMMWNWQLAALGTGASLVIFDGNPSFPDTGAIWRILEQEQVTVFGLSASYIHALMAEGFSPRQHADLTVLRAISQTGSALSDDGFDFIYREIKADLSFNSIAGGTDINGCFNTGNPLSPVYSGELQGPGLGMAIRCYDDCGRHVWDAQGELVCEKSVPSMPLYFWNDTTGERYLDAYFRDFPGVWRHGDYVVFHSDTGGVTYFGRSDSVLKPSGVRIGTAEIYNQVEKLPEVLDSLAIGQDFHGDQRVLLFVLLREGVQLDETLQKRIRTALRVNASPRHVPARIYQVPDIPKTLNGKKVESAVTNIVNGRKVTNRDALQNPEALDFFYQLLPTLQN